MPLYGFSCPHCKHSFDTLQKSTEPNPENCPSCGQGGLAKQVTAPSIRLVGTGWYETDFKSKLENRRHLADAVPEPPRRASPKGP